MIIQLTAVELTHSWCFHVLIWLNIFTRMTAIYLQNRPARIQINTAQPEQPRDETVMPFVYFCPLLNLAMSSAFKSAECGSPSAPLVVSVVLLCINNSTSVATSNRLHRAETSLTVPNIRVDFLVSSAQSTKGLFLDTGGIILAHTLSVWRGDCGVGFVDF